jgi:hypothetical protein
MKILTGNNLEFCVCYIYNNQYFFNHFLGLYIFGFASTLPKRLGNSSIFLILIFSLGKKKFSPLKKHYSILLLSCMYVNS